MAAIDVRNCHPNKQRGAPRYRAYILCLNMGAHPTRIYLLMRLEIAALQRLIGAHFRAQSSHLIILSDFE
jgi:hypothetical protein